MTAASLVSLRAGCSARRCDGLQYRSAASSNCRHPEICTKVSTPGSRVEMNTAEPLVIETCVEEVKVIKVSAGDPVGGVLTFPAAL